MSQISNRPVDWETLVKENEDRLYRAALAIRTPRRRRTRCRTPF